MLILAFADRSLFESEASIEEYDAVGRGSSEKDSPWAGGRIEGGSGKLSDNARNIVCRQRCSFGAWRGFFSLSVIDTNS